LGLHRDGVVLASGSPRRRELLAVLGVPFVVCPVNIDETWLPGERPEEMVVRLSEAKVSAIGARVANRIGVASDTTVVVDEGSGPCILGKPRDREEVSSMVKRLSGREHVVYTGYAIRDGTEGLHRSGYVRARVRLREIEGGELAAYVESGIGDDKAGGYAVQDQEFKLVEWVDGCLAAVMGLPVSLLRQAFVELGLPVVSLDEMIARCRELTGMACNVICLGGGLEP